MNEYKKLLRHFSDTPITIFDLHEKHYDIHTMEVANAFQWLELNKLISPLSGDKFGLRVTSGRVEPVWAKVDLVITQQGKDYLFPPKSKNNPDSLRLADWLLKPLILKVCTFLLIAFLTLIGGVYFSDIKDMFPEILDRSQAKTQQK